MAPTNYRSPIVPRDNVFSGKNFTRFSADGQARLVLGQEIALLRARANVAAVGRPSAHSKGNRHRSWESQLKSELGLSKSSAYRYEALWREAQAALGPAPGEDEIVAWLENRPSQSKAAENTLPAPSEETSVSDLVAGLPLPDGVLTPVASERRHSLRRRQKSASDSTDDPKGRAARNDALQLVGLIDHFVRSKVASRLDASTRELLIRCLTDATADLSQSRR